VFPAPTNSPTLWCQPRVLLFSSGSNCLEFKGLVWWNCSHFRHQSRGLVPQGTHTSVWIDHQGWEVSHSSRHSFDNMLNSSLCLGKCFCQDHSLWGPGPAGRMLSVYVCGGEAGIWGFPVLALHAFTSMCLLTLKISDPWFRRVCGGPIM
jgi:hypothetical protein